MKKLFQSKFVWLMAGIAIVAPIGMHFAFAAVTARLFPIQDGYYKQWYATSTTYYTQVDESPCNGSGDYLWVTTVGKRNSFKLNLTSVPTTTIKRIDIVPCASSNGSVGVTSTMTLFYRWNGADTSATSSYALSSLTVPTTLATTTIYGLSLPKTTTSTLEIGAIYASGTRGIKMSNISAVLTY